MTDRFAQLTYTSFDTPGSAGGWQVNGITTLRGGFPTDIRTNRLPPIFNTFNVPDRVKGQPIQVESGRGPDLFFNAGAFRVPGTVPRNSPRRFTTTSRSPSTSSTAHASGSPVRRATTATRGSREPLTPSASPRSASGTGSSWRTTTREPATSCTAAR